MPKPLTDAAVRKFAPAAKRRRIPDSGMRSLFLVIEPSGHRAWQMRFRIAGGRIGKMTLGPVDLSGNELQGEPVIGMPLTLAAARQLAAKVHRERALGHDPIAEHKAAKERQRAAVVDSASNTFAAAAKEFIEKHASKKVRRWKEQASLLGYRPTANGLELIRGGLAERWSDKLIGKIDGHDIHTLVAETRERGAPGLERRAEQPTESRARAMLSTLSRMYSWLIQHRRVEMTNPCATVHRPPAPEARERVLSNGEIRWLWRACDDLGEPFGAIVKVLLLSGQRLAEVSGLRRDELSTDGATWDIPGSRTKNKKPHRVPLPPSARSLIPDGDQVLVFTTTGMTPPSGWSRAKRRLDALMLKVAQQERGKGAAIAPWRLHDLRRTAVTGMNELGVAPHVIELAVNHISGHRAGVAGIYNKSELLPERKAALERWARHVHGLVSEQPDNVVTMRSRKRRGGR
jgi:integrase